MSNPRAPGHLQCPSCNGYDVTRLYIAAEHVDACECCDCGCRWDEQRVVRAAEPRNRRIGAHR